MNWPLWRGSGSASVSQRQRIGRYPFTRSVCIAPGQAAKNGAQNDLEIERQGPVLDVVEIMFDATRDLLRRLGLAAPAIHLRPAGDARLYTVAGIVVAH